MYQSNIIIDLNTVYGHKSDFLTYLTYYLNTTPLVDWPSSYYRCGDILASGSISDAAKITGLSRETIRKQVKQFNNTYEHQGRFALLPLNTYNKLIEDIQTLSSAERNGVVRLFFYYVCQCWNFQDFSRTKKQIAADMNTKVDLICGRTQWLVDHGYIAYKHKHMHLAGKPAKAAVYQLYIDEVPAHYATGEWFVGHVAARENISIEELLADFKNSF